MSSDRVCACDEWELICFVLYLCIYYCVCVCVCVSLCYSYMRFRVLYPLIDCDSFSNKPLSHISLKASLNNKINKKRRIIIIQTQTYRDHPMSSMHTHWKDLKSKHFPESNRFAVTSCPPPRFVVMKLTCSSDPQRSN